MPTKKQMDELAVSLAERQHLTSLYYEAADNGQLDELTKLEAKVDKRIDDIQAGIEQSTAQNEGVSGLPSAERDGYPFDAILRGDFKREPKPERDGRDDGGREA